MYRNCPLYVTLVLAALSSSAWGDIYKCINESGHVTYSNVVKKGCEKLELEPLSTIPGPKRQATPSAATPKSFPKVEADTQQRRDADRRSILQNELATEERNLEAAKKEVAEQEAVRLGDERNYQKYLDRVQTYKDKVALHERNIESLKRELSNIK